MFGAHTTIVTKDLTGDVQKALDDLSKLQVLVGVPEEKSSRENGEITNAELVYIHTHGVRQKPMREEMQPNVDEHGYSKAYEMYIHEHGSPLWQSPPRPIIEPAIEADDNKEKIAKQLGAAARDALNGQTETAKQQLETAGMQAQNIVRNWWDDPRNNWPANAESTKEEKGSDKPLVDTGDLRKSITYVVREK